MAQPLLAPGRGCAAPVRHTLYFMQPSWTEMKTRQKIRKGLILLSFFLFPAIFYYLSPVLIIQASSKQTGVTNRGQVFNLAIFIEGSRIDLCQDPYGLNLLVHFIM